jgi:hypothetical protein
MKIMDEIKELPRIDKCILTVAGLWCSVILFKAGAFLFSVIQVVYYYEKLVHK